mgnify:CR=1 FL=1
MSRKFGAFDPASTASTTVVTETSDFTNLYLTFDNASTDDSSPQNVTVTDVASASYDTTNVAVGSAAILLYEGSGVTYKSTSADRLRFETSDVVLSSNFTIECFFRTTQGGGDVAGRQSILSYSIYVDNQNGYSGLLFWITSGALYLYASSGGSSWNVFSAQSWGTVSVGTYHHIALTREGNVYRGYFDGARTFETTAGSFHITGSASMIGSRDNGGAYTFNGQIDDFRILNGVALHTSSSLTVPTTNVGINVTAETANTRTHSHVWNYSDIYKARRADSWPASSVFHPSSPSLVSLYIPGDTDLTDASVHGHTLIGQSGAAVSSAESVFGGASVFYNSSFTDVVVNTSPSTSTSLVFGTGDFTLEYFIKTTSTNINVMHPRNESNTGTGYGAHTIQDSKLRWNHRYDVANLWEVNASADLFDNAFHHVAIVRNSGTFKVFIDGVSKSASSGSFSDSSNYVYTSAFQIGGHGNLTGGGYMAGYIDDFRITKHAVYTTAFTVPTAALGIQTFL